MVAHSAPDDSVTSTARSGAGGVHDHRRVVGELAGSVRLRADWAVRTPVAPTVEGHHPEMSRQIWDLCLPEPRMDDRPRRQKQDGCVARAVDLVKQAHAVALDVSVFVRVT